MPTVRMQRVQGCAHSDTEQNASHAISKLRASTLIPCLTAIIQPVILRQLFEYISAHICFSNIEIEEERPKIETYKTNKRQEDKLRFQNFLFREQIMNSRQYNNVLAENEVLRSLELNMNVIEGHIH